MRPRGSWRTRRSGRTWFRASNSSGKPPVTPRVIVTTRKRMGNGENLSCRSAAKNRSFQHPPTPPRTFMMRRLILGVAALLGLATAGSARLAAQAVTTGALTGTVTDESGQPLQGVQIQLKNTANGRAVGTVTRASGLYLIQGLEPDANYVISVRYIGYEPKRREGVVITLGQTRREDFKLARRAAQLEQEDRESDVEGKRGDLRGR